jgi:hypothetical protein
MPDSERSSQVKVKPEPALPVLKPWFAVNKSYSAWEPVPPEPWRDRLAGPELVVHAEAHRRQQ